MKKIKKGFLIIGLIIALFLVLTVIFSSFENAITTKDVLYYKVAMGSFFASFLICFLTELICIQKEKIWILRLNFRKRFFIYLAVVFIGIILCGIFNSLVSDEFMESIASVRPTGATEIENKVTDSDVEKTTEAVAEENDEIATTEPATEKRSEATTVELVTEKSTEIATTVISQISEPTTIKTEKNYSELSDSEFKLLTNILATSFYNFAISDSDNKKLQNNKNVQVCLQKLFDYAYSNCFELDPEFVEVFSTKENVVKECENYELLKKNFAIEFKCDMEKEEWIYSIKSYPCDKNDVYVYDNIVYLDAEGYLTPGVSVYWLEDNKMVCVGEIVDIVIDKEIENVVYAYGINIKYYDDPYSSGWQDGENFLTANKKYAGEPLYYISALDVNRNIQKQVPNYTGSVIWQSLKKATIKTGLKVYSGVNYCKAYTFTIKSFNKSEDWLLVEYENGNTEYKTYSAIINNQTMYVKK